MDEALALGRTLEPLDAATRIELLVERYGHGVLMSTSAGLTSAVLMHLASRTMPGIRVLYVRHGHETPETREHLSRLADSLPVDLRIYDAPRRPVPEAGARHFDRFRKEVKVATFDRALRAESPAVWLSGVIHDKSRDRLRFPMVSRRGNVICVYPVLDWTGDEAVDYCRRQRLPLNLGYSDPFKGEDQRLECGIHSHNLAALG